MRGQDRAQRGRQGHTQQITINQKRNIGENIMSNLEKYNGVFRDVFMVEDAVLNDAFDNKSVDGWDSVKQLALTTALEDTFDIMLDAEDILELTSYAKGKEIMRKYEVEL